MADTPRSSSRPNRPHPRPRAHAPAKPADSAQPATAARIAPARAVAAHILLLVERGTAHSDHQLHSPGAEALTRQDRDLMTQLVLGTLRWERLLDQEIAARLAKPDAEMHLGVIVALRLGAYQLLFLDRIPAHAAIGESVELAKQADGQYAANMVNAVLRRLAREQAPGAKVGQDPEAAHPAWMVARWRQQFGVEVTARLCAYDQSPAPMTLRLLDERAEASLAAAGVVLAPGEFLSSARRVESGDVAGTAAFASGWVRLQDEASQLVGELAALLPPLEGTRILDTCAAPGGKTAILLERNGDAEVTAMDVSEARLRAMRLRHGVLKMGGRLQLVVADAAKLPSTPAYDAILCDVPCSGTGTLARNPEIRHRLDLDSFARQHDRQVSILTAALGVLKPGGRLVYSTCSLEPEEDEQVVAAVLRVLPGYELLPIGEELRKLAAAGVLHAEGLASLEAASAGGSFLRTVPGVHGCDGFFAAVIRRP